MLGATEAAVVEEWCWMLELACVLAGWRWKAMRWVFKLWVVGIGGEWPKLGKKGVLRWWHTLGVTGRCEEG